MLDRMLSRIFKWIFIANLASVFVVCIAVAGAVMFDTATREYVLGMTALTPSNPIPADATEVINPYILNDTEFRMWLEPYAEELISIAVAGGDGMTKEQGKTTLEELARISRAITAYTDQHELSSDARPATVQLWQQASSLEACDRLNSHVQGIELVDQASEVMVQCTTNMELISYWALDDHVYDDIDTLTEQPAFLPAVELAEAKPVAPKATIAVVALPTPTATPVPATDDGMEDEFRNFLRPYAMEFVYMAQAHDGDMTTQDLTIVVTKAAGISRTVSAYQGKHALSHDARSTTKMLWTQAENLQSCEKLESYLDGTTGMSEEEALSFSRECISSLQMLSYWGLENRVYLTKDTPLAGVGE